MIRIWEEVTKIILNFLQFSPNSPFKKVVSIFERKEYQQLSGNLSHTHLILEVLYNLLSVEEQKFVNELIRASVIDVIRYNEIDDYIKNNIITCKEDVHDVVNDGVLFLTHRCNDRCLVRGSNGDMRCRLPPYLKLTPDNKKHSFVDLPNCISDSCWGVLNKIGLCNLIHNEEGKRNIFQSSLEFFIQNVIYHL